MMRVFTMGPRAARDPGGIAKRAPEPGPALPAPVTSGGG